jgi:DNA-3-methyladenine glycosylase I
MTGDKQQRCSWCGTDSVYVRYHDKEWGVPVYSDRKLFEMLILEGAQAGLSWITVLKKRPHYRKVFDRFNPEVIARYNRKKIQQLLNDPGIIRNRLKVEGTVKNAKAYLRLRESEGRLSDFLWQFVDNEPIINRWRTLKQVPAKTSVSDAMSKELKSRGFTFVGSTICYAFMQSIGMVNDHTTDCFRYSELC